jgi:hypothetical protein
MDPELLAGHPQGNEHKIGLHRQQTLLQIGPGLRVSVAVNGHHQLEIRDLRLQPVTKMIQHRGASPHQGHAPSLACGMFQKVAS